MRSKLFAIFIILTISTINVQAQQGGAAIDVTCDSVTHFDVYPGANTTSTLNCTLENPTSYDEVVELSHSDIYGFSVVFVDGNTTDVPAGATINFTIELDATEGMAHYSHPMSITATVIEANGNPPPNTAQSNYNSILQINSFDNYEISPTNLVASFTYNNNDSLDETIEISIINNGNYQAKFSLENEDLYDKLESYNLTYSMPLIEVEVAMNETNHLNFSLGSNPEINTSSWVNLSNGTKLLTIDTEILVSSDANLVHGIYCYQCNSTFNLTIEIYSVPYEPSIDDDPETHSIPGFEGSLSLLSLICAAIIVCRRDRY